MSIVCATDFSEPSSGAVRAAARLAARMKVPLHLVHSLEINFDQMQGEPRHSLERWATEKLNRKADDMRDITRDVQTHVTAGPPDDEIIQIAQSLSAELIVLAAVGARPSSSWQLGSHAERVAQRSHVPVLVVRDERSFEAWTAGARPLRVMVALDFSESSNLAARWAYQLTRYGECELVGVHLYWPPHEFHRLGLLGVRDYLTPDPVVTEILERELQARFEPARGVPLRIRLEPHVGNRAERLARIAADEQADLIVVGSHARSALSRLWEGSVSRGILENASTSVACVSAGTGAPIRVTKPIETVVAATDFSAIGDAAIALAYGVVQPGGTVHLVHVQGTEGDTITARDVLAPSTLEGAEEHELLGRLARLAPVDADEHAKATRVHLLASNDVAGAICQAGERLNADLFCLGTHGRSGLAKTLLGSVAESVLHQTRRPVLLARRGEE